MRRVSPVLMLFSLLLAFGCEEETSSPGVAINLYAAPDVQDPFAGVGFIRIIIDGADIAPQDSLVRFGPAGSATVDGVPYGADRQVTIEGWSASETGSPVAVVSRGRSVPTDVLQGQAELQLQILFARVNTFVPLTAPATLQVQSLTQGRVGHTVTPTARGEIVVAGGGIISQAGAQWWDPAACSSLLKSVEIISAIDHTVQPYQPATADGPAGMFFDRIWHTATALNTGQVLLAGGYYTTTASTGESCTDQCAQGTCVDGTCRVAVHVPGKRVEVYYPAPNRDIRLLIPEVDLSVARAGHTATLIDDKEYTLLFVGGDKDGEDGSYEVWTPVAGTIAQRPLPDGFRRRYHEATLFKVPGRTQPAVLITGGANEDGPIADALVYDVATDTMYTYPSALAEGRVHHTTTYVPGRNYLYIAGGFTRLDRSKASTAIDVYDIAKDQFLHDVGGFRLHDARGGHTATLMTDNSVLLSGGVSHSGAVLDSIEIIYEYMDPEMNKFVISVAPSGQEQNVPYLAGPRYGQRSIFLDNGMTLLVGGVQEATDGTVTMPTDISLYNPQ